MKYDYDVAVIGAGSGGLTLAEIASNLGLKAVLLEGSEMGGDCLNYGCVPSKAMLKSATMAHTFKHPEKYGLSLKGSVGVEWSTVRDRIARVIEDLAYEDSQERFEKELGVTVMREFGSFVDSHTIKAGGNTFTAKYIFIATGSGPFIPPIEGLKDVGYETNESIFTMEELPKRCLVIGAGPIGCELGQSLQRLGSEVVMAVRDRHVLSRFDEDTAFALQEQLLADGMTIHTNVETEKLEKKGKSIVAYLKDKTSGEVIQVGIDQVLVATGRKPNLDKLNLDVVGISYNKRAIEVDSKMRCRPHKHIFAIGDINGKALFTHGAGFDAFTAAKTAFYKIPSKIDYTFLPATIYTAPEIAMIGLSEKQAKEQGIEYTLAKKSFEHLDRAVTDEVNQGFCKYLIDKKERIIGAQIVGPQAGELLHEVALCMTTGQKASAIATMIHTYPTLSDINRQTAFEYYKPKWYSRFLKTWVRFWF